MTGIERRAAPVRAAAPVLGGIGVAAGLATVAIQHRRRLRRDNERMRILADLAGVANGGETAEQIAQAIADLLVPRLVDICAIDMLRADARVHRIAARVAAGAGSGELLVRDAVAGPAAGSGDGAALPDAVVHRLVPRRGRRRRREPGEPELGSLARDEAELRLLEEMRTESAVAVPLAPRGRTLGRLLLA
ncbi:MAG TPA: hypothetical protein VE127_10195, partial [Solirubrobacteraceae bacterium]|nr:hypothetical protein [Solirubrobacteraceae bacterium]